VPGPTKAEAVKRTLEGPISTACPATILRKHENAILFLDEDSAKFVRSVQKGK
jgi:glucosamine-6-phosphate deaminase